MKRIITLTMLLLAVGTVSAQQVASRAKAMRITTNSPLTLPPYSLRAIEL